MKKIRKRNYQSSSTSTQTQQQTSSTTNSDNASKCPKGYYFDKEKNRFFKKPPGWVDPNHVPKRNKRLPESVVSEKTNSNNNNNNNNKIIKGKSNSSFVSLQSIVETGFPFCNMSAASVVERQLFNGSRVTVKTKQIVQLSGGSVTCVQASRDELSDRVTVAYGSGTHSTSTSVLLYDLNSNRRRQSLDFDAATRAVVPLNVSFGHVSSVELHSDFSSNRLLLATQLGASRPGVAHLMQMNPAGPLIRQTWQPCRNGSVWCGSMSIVSPSSSSSSVSVVLGTTRRATVYEQRESRWHARHLFTDSSDVLACRFMASPSVVVSGARDGRLRVFDMRASHTHPPHGTHAPTSMRQTTAVSSVVVELDNCVLASDMHGVVRRWDLRTGRYFHEWTDLANADRVDASFCASGNDVRAPLPHAAHLVLCANKVRARSSLYFGAGVDYSKPIASVDAVSSPITGVALLDQHHFVVASHGTLAFHQLKIGLT